MSNKDLEDFLDSIPGLPKIPNQSNNIEKPQTQRNEFGEIDVNSLLQQRMLQKMQQQTTSPIGNPDMPINQNRQYDMVFLREGQMYYKAVPAQESTMPIAMYAGPIANVSGKEFINKGARKYYVVEGHSPIDLSKPDYTKLKVLYAVEAPWIGTILVPESALVKQNNGPQLLKG